MGSRSYRAGDFVYAARRLGIDLVVGGDWENVLGASAAGHALPLDFAEADVSLEAIRALHAARPLDAILATEDAGTLLAARASAELGLPGSPAESVASASNKRVFREICTAAGLRQPGFMEISLDDDPRDIARRLHFPCVIKPLHLSASRGVIRCDDAASFAAGFRRVKALLTRPEVRRRDPGLARRALVEDYLPGAEVAVEGLVFDGRFEALAFFDKPDPLYGPFFQESLFVTPSRHPVDLQQAALDAVGRAVKALGLRQGPVHAEARLHNGAATLIELAPRSIGGHCGRTLRFGSGMTLEELILAQALDGYELDLRREGMAAGVMMIPIAHEGVLREVEGVAAARAVPGIEGLEIAIPMGEFIEPPPEGDRYLGFIFARGGTPSGVEAALREAHSHLQIRIDPPG